MFSQIYAQAVLPQSMSITMQGFLLCASLIIAVGPQNLFVLRQGLRRRHLLMTALLCTLFDLVLIGVGVGGIGTAIATNPRLLTITTLGGAAFLFGYAVRSFRTAWGAQGCAVQADEMGLASVKGTVLATLSFSFLNPAAYLDTLLMIGTASGRYPLDERLLFGVGAIAASCVWFFTLIYGASRLSPCLRYPAAWRALDLISGCMMVGLAVSLSATQFPRFW
ncbi:LysE/ArgO family amino acid transporter [soil metagenome]